MACYLIAWLLVSAVRVPGDASMADVCRTPVIALAMVTIVLAGGAASIERSAEWVDESTLFTADLAKYPNSARLNNYVGSINFFAGDRIIAGGGDAAAAAPYFETARLRLRRGLELGGGDFLEMHAVLGMAEYQLKDCINALPHLQQAMSFENYRVRSMEMLGDCYEQTNNPSQALDVYRQLDAEGVVYPHGWFQLGNSAAAIGDDVSSTRYFKKVLDATPDNQSALVNLALGEFRLNHFAESLETAVRCLAVQPDQARCLFVAAEDEARLGHPDRAAHYAARARGAIK